VAAGLAKAEQWRVAGASAVTSYASGHPPEEVLMADKSVFTEDEWHAITEAPLLVTAAIFAAGEHGPISMIKEASASARAIAVPGPHGVANQLIAQIVADADSQDARHELKAHRAPTIEATIDSTLESLRPAAAALKKIDPIEAAEVAVWLVDIAQAVASAAKTVNPTEQETIEKITTIFRVTSD
jgi:hypothetical protein